MKILIVSKGDYAGGGGYRAAYRLHKALVEQNISSQMLVQSKSLDDYTVIGPTTKFSRLVSMLRPTVDEAPVYLYKQRSKVSFSPSWLGFNNTVQKINELNPDIVHLHWVCGGMIKIEDFAKIKAPIVWSLHDMWPFTGGCHYSDGCDNYEISCGNCKVLGSKKEYDLSKVIWKRKIKAYSSVKNSMTIVGLSKWLYSCSKNSSLLNDKNNVNLPNPIDVKKFKPFSKKKSRELWGFSNNKKLILFGALSATSDERKGYNEMTRALKKIKSNNIEIIIIGSSEPKEPPGFGFVTHFLGYLHDEISLITLLSAVDLLVVPSLQENLSNSIMESLSCGTPVIAFDVGGNSDMVVHKENGYLVKPFDTTDLKDGIEWMLNTNQYANVCKNARDKVVSEFDYPVVAKKYIKLYRDILM
jgi:glycosyltransferase involved in cell wall biosynthesis